MKVLLAVSGGIDSMYMLHRAPELFPGASFAVAHCNFSLRGAESDGDEAFVRSECARLGIECLVRRFDTAVYAEGHGVSIEMAARELRYRWFKELCEKGGFDALATAHNANDNAETMILNLLRGTGTKGLRGIPGGFTGDSLSREPSSHHPSGVVPPLQPRAAILPGETVPGEAIMLLRPLLGTGRDDIRRWMKAHGHSWREDSTNKENDARRNKIRNQVFPVFKEINPSFIKTLGEDMARIRQTDDIAEDYFRQAYGAIVKQKDNTLEISVVPLIGLKHWRYVLWRILEGCSFSSETFSKLCALLERYSSEPRGTVTLSGKTFQSPTYNLKGRRKLLVLAKREQ
ncbi:MAG: tRNA lysidine(34) synthetase TilS [Bacteroidales bacterium]|nr:tRNA lysidine(34) synthetase TilS [Bacteroidales bacterium]